MSSGKDLRFLIVSLSNIGDVILTTPVIMRVAESYPGARLTVVAGPKAASLLEPSRYIDRLVIYDKRASWPEKIRFAASLRGPRYEAVIDLRNTAIPFLVSARRRSPLLRNHSETSMRARHLEVLKWSGLPVRENAGPFDFFSAPEVQSAEQKLLKAGVPAGPLILIAAGAASSRKRWPLDRYAETLRRLLEIYAGSAVLIGDSSERPYVETLCAVNPKRVFNLAGLTSLRETAAVISRCDLLLTNDSAAMHLGHELGRRVAAVFGPTPWQAYGRTGENFRLLKPKNALTEISGEDSSQTDFFPGVSPGKVFDACRELLLEPRPSQPTFSL